MKRTIYILTACLASVVGGCGQQQAADTADTAGTAVIGEQAIGAALSAIGAADPAAAEAGVRQVARLWRAQDGSEADFGEFCKENYISDPAAKRAVFDRISFYMEGINGFYNQMNLRQRYNTDLDSGPLYPIDEMFAAYSPSAHLSDDLYSNKIAFIVALNFPEVPLAEKERLGNDRLGWAYARMGDMFTQRIPAAVQQQAADAGSASDIYTSSYNIHMGHLLTEDGRRIFPNDMVLLSHWNLRDEIKSNYNKGDAGVEKQRMVYRVMERIVSQEIPVEVIDSPDYDWSPYSNTLAKEGRQVTPTPESTERYQQILNNFHAMQQVDRYTGNTFIDRKFSQEMEVSVDEAEALFDSYLSAPELRQVGALITQRLGRPLEAYDIWYDGFKARSNLNEDNLSAMTRRLYPTAGAFEQAMPSILQRLGWTPQRARYIAEKIAVDAARGSGHAWGTAMKGQKSHLRTRLTDNGMDYKGYNIAVHEFGHNVEQTISMYDVDHYMLNGVPNTAFTEALAFVFQKRDLDLLGVRNDDPEADRMDVLDKAWSLYEICGVSMLDIAIWKWLYANPEATAEQLRDKVIELSKEIWNRYFAPVFGIKDQTVLAVYSHMISYPLYLSAYAFGQLIEFQLERHLEGKHFANEVDRIFRLGRLTPNAWMMQATGSPLSAEPILNALRGVLN